MTWLRLVGSLKLEVSLAKEPYKRDDVLQKRPPIFKGLLIVATPKQLLHTPKHQSWSLDVISVRDLREGGIIEIISWFNEFHYVYCLLVRPWGATPHVLARGGPLTCCHCKIC